MIDSTFVSPIGGKRFGPFSPQSRQRASPECPPTQLGPAPAAELPRGGYFFTAPRHETSGRARANLYQALGATRSGSQEQIVCDLHEVR
jgi:hypothetical protein